MKTKYLSLFYLIATFPLSECINAQTEYEILASVFGGGGSTLSSSNFRISVTAGQTLIGVLQASTFRKQVGFWRPALLLTPVEEFSELTPTEYRLDQNFPNPFNSSTQISYNLSKATEVELIIYNVVGQKVKTLVNEFQTVGPKSIVWNGLDDHRTAVSSGLYLFQLRAGVFQKTKRMILLR